MTRPPVTAPRWRVTDDEAGSRLDKFLASPNRLGSRSRVVTALDRGRVIVNDKPAGLLSVPLDVREAAASIFEQVEDHLRRSGKRRPLVVHRIDRDTSGLVVFGMHGGAQRQLKEQFRRREPERIYWA